ncbi:hypothetical protein [Haloterrigena gelatinilytica]|uniref:hypothetical protein n=1 Tax=Haloterrigena gelatinilytica TaxID=2741724 RepID=UPI0020C68669|nr:hypothetical protein [Haloterrigena gelatinilytica]
MGLSNLLPDSGRLGTHSRREATDSVTDRLESSAEAVGDLSTRVRDAANRRASDVAERAVDELFERALDRSADDLLAASDLGGGEGAAEFGSDDPLDRALENFLRRYGLDEDRLDDRTLDAIRTRLSVAGADADAADLLAEVLSERSAASDGTASAVGPADRDSSAVAESRSNGETDRPIDVRSPRRVPGSARDWTMRRSVPSITCSPICSSATP